MNKEKYFGVINQLSDKELVKHLYLTQAFLLLLSILLSTIVFPFNWSLFQFDFQQFLIGIAAGLMVVFIDIIWMKVLPEKYHDDGGLNHRVFASRNPFHIAIIAATVAFSEELLFRGIIQTEFGLLISSVVFALIHYRYLFNWFLFANIILLSLLIGYIFQLTNNLWVTIMMHFLIDFLLGIIIRYKWFGYKVNRDNHSLSSPVKNE
ncbi:MAG: CPBP family intramembrane glutamic endopeptidase [Bacillus sp. (in: firmicutes)]